MSSLSLRCIFLIACLVLFGCDTRKEEGLSPGKFAPIVELEALTGEKTTLEAYRGKVVLLNFWTSWCFPCKEEMPSLQKLHDEFSGQDFSVVAVAVDDNLPAIKDFVKDKEIRFPVLYDRGGKSNSKFSIGGYPESFFLDKEGKVLFVSDLQSGQPTARIIGPREWHSAQARSLVKQLLERSEVHSTIN